MEVELLCVLTADGPGWRSSFPTAGLRDTNSGSTRKEGALWTSIRSKNSSTSVGGHRHQVRKMKQPEEQRTVRWNSGAKKKVLVLAREVV